ncbi:hypothetical protein GW17_00033057 [Ensete ventricosum]|nr:hypothetical protein GW17_00033057 [Ensete ventricosum]
MDLNVLHRKPRVQSRKNTLATGAESSPPKVEEIRVETTTKRPMALLDRVHDVGHLVTIMGNQASLLEVEIDKLKAKGDPKQLAIARQQVDELQVDNTKLKSELDELTRHLEQIDKELNELREGLAKSQR